MQSSDRFLTFSAFINYLFISGQIKIDISPASVKEASENDDPFIIRLKKKSKYWRLETYKAKDMQVIHFDLNNAAGLKYAGLEYSMNCEIR